MGTDAPDPKTQSEADEKRKEEGITTPGKLPGEGAGPSEAKHTAGGSVSDDADAGDSSVEGAGGSGGADSAPADGAEGDSSATGAGGSGGAES